MKRIQKLASFLMRPRRRGFSRIDFFVLLFLAAVTTVNMLVWTMQPSQLAAPAPAASNATAQSRSHTTALAIPQAPAVPATLAASQSPYDRNRVSARTMPAQAASTMDDCKNPGPFTQWLMQQLGTGWCHLVTKVDCTGGNYVTDPDCIEMGAVDQMDSKVVKLQGPFSGLNTVFFVTDPYITVAEPQVQDLWKAALTGVNAFCVVLLALTGLRIAVGGSVFRHANAIEMLPRILLALIAAQVSMGLMTVCVGINDYTTVAAYQYANGLDITTAQYNGQDIVTQTCNHWDALGGAAAGAALGSSVPVVGTLLGGIAGYLAGDAIGCNVNPYTTTWSQSLLSGQTPQNVTQGFSLGGILQIFQDAGNLLQTATEMLILALLGQMVVRLFYLDFYIITAPIGIAGMAWPGQPGQTVTRMWVHGFTSTLFTQFLQVMGLFVIRILAGAITSAIYASLSKYVGNNITNDSTLLWVVQIAQYWFLLRLPSLLSTGPGSPMNQMVSFGQTVTQLVQMNISEVIGEFQMVSSVAMMAGGALLSRMPFRGE